MKNGNKTKTNTKDYFSISNRDIAKWIVSRMPIEFREPEDFRAQIEAYHEQIQRLPTEAKRAFRCAMVFASKVPHQEREDLFQDLVLTLFEKRLPDERLAYAICRCNWMNWWRSYKIKSHFGFVSVEDLDHPEDEDLRSQGEILIGEIEFETRMCDRAEARHILSHIPARIKALGRKRMLGKSLNAAERQQLSRFLRANPLMILSQK